MRIIDLAVPAYRFDKALNRPLPAEDDLAVREALDRWSGMTPAERERYPTPYHVYAGTPAPGTFEGPHIVGLAFSGGGTRGTVFSAMVVKRLEALGDIIVGDGREAVRVSLFDEVDYVSGVSSGAFLAALYALNQNERRPERFDWDYWPDCINVDLTAAMQANAGRKPHVVVRDMVFGLNTRTVISGAMAQVFFDARTARPGAGMTFRALPSTPILLLGSTVTNDPGAHFIQTRLPYRYTIDRYPAQPWGVGDQTFESFRSDPMQYALGEACYNSASFPGYMRSGLMKVLDDPAWVFDTLPEPERGRMLRARNQPGYEGVYDIREGGLVENCGVQPIDNIFMHLAGKTARKRLPLMLNPDAGYRELRPAEKGRGMLKKGWAHELYAASRASWHEGQETYERLFAAHGESRIYAYARFRFVAWTPYMAEDKRGTPEAEYLEALCKSEPLVGTPEKLLHITRGIGSTFAALSDAQMAAERVTADFAVWHDCHRLLDWASEAHDGAPARFERPLDSPRQVAAHAG